MTPLPQDSSLTPEDDAPFSDQQLRWLSAREHMLSAHGTHYSRTHIKRYAKSALAGFLILLTGIGAAIHLGDNQANNARRAVVGSGRAVSVAGCNRDFDTITRVRSILLASEAFQAKQHRAGKITDEQFKAAKDFYQDQLSGLPLPDCREAAHILTDDPTKRVIIPVPRYPGDGDPPRVGG
jgi:hypothetical protein